MPSTSTTIHENLRKTSISQSSVADISPFTPCALLKMPMFIISSRVIIDKYW